MGNRCQTQFRKIALVHLVIGSSLFILYRLQWVYFFVMKLHENFQIFHHQQNITTYQAHLALLVCHCKSAVQNLLLKLLLQIYRVLNFMFSNQLLKSLTVFTLAQISKKRQQITILYKHLLTSPQVDNAQNSDFTPFFGDLCQII